jgi:hypothetical protein
MAAFWDIAFNETTWRYIPESYHFHTHRCENCLTHQLLTSTLRFSRSSITPNTGSQDEARNYEPLKLLFLTLDAVRTWISHVGKVTLITDNHASMKRMWFHIRFQSTFVICNLRKHCGTCPCIWFMTLKVNSFDRNVCFTTIGLLYTSFIYRQGCGNVAHILVLYYVRIVLCEMQCSVLLYYSTVPRHKKSSAITVSVVGSAISKSARRLFILSSVNRLWNRLKNAL